MVWRVFGHWKASACHVIPAHTHKSHTHAQTPPHTRRFDGFSWIGPIRQSMCKKDERGKQSVFTRRVHTKRTVWLGAVGRLI